MWNDQRIAVVLPTYNERDSIAAVIKGFQALGIVDDIVVVNNNATPGTSDEVAGTGAREVHEATQGYGAAIRRGLREAAGADLICICEPDGTFEPRDLHKLLPFTAECEVVFGSRTVSTYIWRGANMGWFLRWGNWAVAKMIGVLSRDAAAAIEPCYTREGSSFGLEQLVLVVSSGASFVQVPVNYRPRVGESAVTGDLMKAVKLGIEMIGIALRSRLRRRSLRRRMGPIPGPR
jgi:glycosyltransferase involved in cell wall biosynthesis